MEITYVIIIALVAYVCGAITKLFIDAIPDKYIPFQNVIIGIISALICYFANIESSSGCRITTENLTVCGIAGDYCVFKTWQNLNAAEINAQPIDDCIAWIGDKFNYTIKKYLFNNS